MTGEILDILIKFHESYLKNVELTRELSASGTVCRDHVNFSIFFYLWYEWYGFLYLLNNFRKFMGIFLHKIILPNLVFDLVLTFNALSKQLNIQKFLIFLISWYKSFNGNRIYI